MSKRESRWRQRVVGCGFGLQMLACGGLAADGALPVPVTRLDRKLAEIAADLEAMPASERRFARYLLLAEHDNGAYSYLIPDQPVPSEADRQRSRARVFERERGQVNALVNRLSTADRVNAPRALDADDHILRLDLRDYAWARGVDVAGRAYADAWEAIASAAQLPLDLVGPHAERLRELSGSARPLLFVNDVLGTAPAPDLYYGLLALPDTLGALQQRLGSGVLGEAASDGAMQVYRAGFNTSTVTRTSRGVERRSSAADASRGYWQAFDFLDDERGSAVFNDPIDFTPDGIQVMFTLPNGLQGFYLADAGGARTTDYALGSYPPSDPELLPRSFATCIGCHSNGVSSFRDQVRVRYMSNDDTVPPSVREEVLAMYPAESVMSRLVDDDNSAYAETAAALGDDSVGALDAEGLFSSQFGGSLSPELAASLLFVSLDELSAVAPQSWLYMGQLYSLGPDAYREAYAELFCVLQRESLNQLASCR
jgi:hypothetical protein